MTRMLLLLLALAGAAAGQGLLDETLLHPMDCPTAYTLEKNEFIYNIPPGIPVGWMWWGVTDWLTVEIDSEALLGGVPSVNGRFALCAQDGGRPALAVEAMTQYLPDPIDLLEDYDFLTIEREGFSLYTHLNASWNFNERHYLHAAVGATYSETLLIENGNRGTYHGKLWEKETTPDFAIGYGWRARAWMSVHAAASSGTTFTYIDNVPHKDQFMAGCRFAPAHDSKTPFWRNFRIEIGYLHFRFEDARESIGSPFGYLYWQWGSGSP